MPAPPCSAGDFDCLIEPRQSVDIRAASEGLISKINVDRGDLIKTGQVLVELDSGLERANTEVARFRAAMETPIEARSIRADYLKIKSARRDNLAAKNFVSAQDRDETASEHRLAVAELAEARDDKRLAELEHRRAAEQLRLRTIRSPFNGVVVDRLMHPGDLADNRDLRKPILKIADLSVLYVEVLLPASAYGSVKVGQSIDVFPESPAGGKYQAKVRAIDRLFDAASATFGVRLELPNAELKLPAGVRCRARVDGVSEAASRLDKQRPASRRTQPD